MSEPTLKDLLLCDLAFRDERRRFCLVGIYTRNIVEVLPAASSPGCIYWRVVDVALDGTISLQFETPGGLVLWTSGPIHWKGSERGELQGAVIMPPTMLQALGKYRIAAYIGEERLGDTVLEVVRAEAV
jgi:hypothetical protein